MTLKVNLKAVKEKLNKRRDDIQNKTTNRIPPEDQFILRVPQPGKYLFRALPYVHSENPGENPLFEASYIYGVPVRGKRIFYSVKENDGVEKDPLTEFVWNQLKSVKGKKDKNGDPVARQWSKFLPKMTVFLPGVLRGQEDKGVKFLKISTQKNEPSDKHNSLWDFFLEEDTECWMDSEKGFDLELQYESHPQFGICLKKGPLVLARKSTKLNDFDKYLASMPNLLEDEEINGMRNGYVRRTLEETKELLAEWMSQFSSNVKESRHNEDSDTEITFASDDSVDDDDGFFDSSSEDSSVSDMEKRLAEAGL